MAVENKPLKFLNSQLLHKCNKVEQYKTINCVVINCKQLI